MIRFAALCLAIFLVWTALVLTSATAGLDRWLAPGEPVGAARTWWHVVALVTLPVIVNAGMLVVAAWLFLARWRRLAIAVVASVAFAWGGSWAIKLALGRERPASAEALGLHTMTSYPSGHVVAMTAAVTTLVLALRAARLRPAPVWWLRGLAAALVTLVAVDRVALGAHWASDVVGGFWWGLTATALAFAVTRPRLETAVTPSTERRLCAVVVNPVKVRQPEAFRRFVTEEAERREYEVLWLETTADDAGHGMAREALAAGADLVIAAGGDGTIRIVASTLADSGVALGVVPAGTGNLLARNLGLAMDQQRAVLHALDGVDRAVDLVRLTPDEDPERAEHFAVMAGIGLDAIILDRTDEKLKKSIGSTAYFLAAARELGRHDRLGVRVRLDDADPIELTSRVLVVGNVGFIQAGITVMPDARPDDGTLDVVLGAPRSPRQWVAFTLRLLLRRRSSDETLSHHQARRVVVEAERPEQYQLDGDPAGEARTLMAEVAPGALTLRVPRS